MNLFLAEAASDGGTTLLWGFLLIGATILLVAWELIIPCGGFLALAAAATVIGAIAAFFAHDTTTGLVASAAVAIFGPLLAWLGWTWWSGTAMAERLVLTETTAHKDTSRELLLHANGVAETDLRPIGMVRIHDQRHEALSEHGVIPQGSSITVIKVLDNQLKVRLCDDAPSEHTS